MNIGYNRVQDPSRYGAIILAAGLSSRMNAFKPMLPVDGRPAVTGLTESLRGAGISDIIIVTGHQRELLQEEISRLRVAECYNENYADGMFTSIQAGFAKATEEFPEKRGWFLVPADCPLITIRTFKELMTAMDDAEKSAGSEDIRFYVPTYEGKKGHPLLVPAEMIPEILAHDGSGGLKAVTDRYPDQMIRVPVPDEEILLDMDTPEGYEDIRAFADRGFTREKLEVLSSRKRVFLVRHGQTRQHEEPVFIGQYDVPLSEEGLAQAKDIGREIAEAIADDVFAEKNYVEGVSLGREPLPAIERIYCSDLSRSVDSARQIADEINQRYQQDEIVVDIRPMEGLREVALGDWEGRPVREIRETQPEAYERRGRDLFSYKTGNDAENFYDVQYRAVTTLRNILQDDYARNIIIVAHAGVLRAIENNLKGQRVDDPWEPIDKGTCRIWTERQNKDADREEPQNEGTEDVDLFRMQM